MKFDTLMSMEIGKAEKAKRDIYKVYHDKKDKIRHKEKYAEYQICRNDPDVSELHNLGRELDIACGVVDALKRILDERSVS